MDQETIQVLIRELSGDPFRRPGIENGPVKGPKVYFDSLEDFWDYIDRPLDKECTMTASETPDYSGWSGTKNFAEARDLARFGDPKSLAKIKPLLAEIRHKVLLYAPELQPVYDVVGEIPDIGAFLSGEPEHMIRFEMQEGIKRIVRILVNGAASASVGRKEIELRGAMICAVIDSLEAHNIRAEVFYYEGISWKENGRYVHGEHLLRIKKAEEPLNFDRLGFVLTNASMLRRIIFRAQEINKDFWGCLTEGYGRPESLPEDKKKDYDIVLDHMMGGDPNYINVENTIKHTFELLKQCGVELEVPK